ncbi:MAG: hypothetical protein Q7S59_10080, partial [Sulfurimonas sp.]|nr:hypothetical protein [Sulfurimonas sp.]
MKKIFIFLLFALVLSAGIVPGSESVSATPVEDLSLDTNIQNPQTWKKQVDTKIQEKIKKTVESPKNITPVYFEAVKFVSAQTAKDLVCPPLTTEYKDKGYVSRVDYIDVKLGQIMCSVVQSEDTNAAPIAKQTFTNDAFVNKFEKLSVKSTGFDSKIDENALKTNESFNKNLIYQSVKNSTLDDDKRLNFVKLLDAMAGLNTDIIDIQKTIELQDLSLANGYYYQVNDTPAAELKFQLLQTIREASKELLNDNGFGAFNPFKSPDTINYLPNNPEKAESLANAETVFLVNWAFDIAPTLTLLLQALALGIIGWNVVYLGFKLINDEKQTKNREVLLSGLFVLFIFIFFGAANDIRITNDQNKEIELSKTRAQDLIGAAYMETGKWADDLVRATIVSYLKKFHQSHNIQDTGTIHKTEDELVKLREELSMLNSIEQDVCSKQFDLTKIENQQKINNVKAGSQYGKTEAEAQKMFDNPYQTLLKEEYVSKKTNSTGETVTKVNNGVMSLSACSNNLEKTKFAKANIAKYERRIDEFNSVANLELKQAKIELINTTVWHMYDQYGYFSIAFLPVIESINRVFDIFETEE